MKRILLFVSIVVATAFLVVSESRSQNSPAAAAPSGPDTTVIDIGEVFKNHPGFKSEMEAMKKDVQAFEAELTGRGKEIEQLREQMRLHKMGTPDYKRLEQDITRKQADGQAQTQLKRNEFLQREATIYYKTYMDISGVVEQFAERYGISLVLRFNSKDIQPQDRNSVLEGVNRNVVYQSRRDITGSIIKMIGRRSAGVANRQSAGSAATRTTK